MPLSSLRYPHHGESFEMRQAEWAVYTHITCPELTVAVGPRGGDPRELQVNTLMDNNSDRLKSLIDKILEVNRCDVEWDQAEDFHMTLPFERARSINFARTLLTNLLINDRSEDVITDETKELIRSALRHYPTEYDVMMLSEKCPEILFTSDDMD